MSQVLEIGQDQFEREVIQETLPVLVDFWAPWCNPCKVIAPVLEELAADYGDQLKVAKVNVDENSQLAQRFGIMSIPTLLLFKNGEVVEKMMGVQPKGVIANKIQPHL
ncbi:MAG TPA: thioredoxin [Bacillota bacterium]|jgi:thioredoxin 1|nr:thioredoxin [Bacillota bacterium]HOB86272.1 thioredoxin [Bacillota bacterium]HOP69561.1 thioredoxin [Bacillota bacterium]HPT34170.1 thioredoxin [Bacillota bacterium]HQD05979.1 thioredoxin [Bacillota bacterium]